ncbi:MAG: ABC transporter ATP-binding protein [bacterium]|nr:ABC transporter ATP-binding protein [bacterium]
MTIIRAENLRKIYRTAGERCSLEALAGVSCEVTQGECVGVIGRNGSGKTTLLRMLAGVLNPDEGAVEVTGEKAALIEPTGGIELDASGAENLRNLLILQGLAPARLPEVLEKACAFSELDGFLEQPVRTYSSGMIMRLAFAGVILLDVDVLLVDEIMSVGDPVFQRKCANEIRRFTKEGGTMILASHDYHQVAALCERVILLEQGKVAIDGPADEVFRAFWQRNEKDLMRITAQDDVIRRNPLKALTPLAESSGEIRIEAVRLLNDEGEDVREACALSPLTIEIVFSGPEAVDSPMCRVQFHRADGLFVMGSNTFRHGIDLGRFQGRGELRLTYESLPLAEGEYFVSVGLWPDEYRSFIAERAYHYLENAFVLRVSQKRQDGGGIVATRHRWTYRNE